MNELECKLDRKKYYLRYFLMISIVLIVCYMAFAITGKTFVGENDSVMQHYPNLFKIRDLYKDLFNSLIHGEIIKQIDCKIFYGSDIIQTYNYYGYGNPLMLLLMLFSDNLMPHAYQLIYMLCIVLGGIAFSEFCFYHKKVSDKYVLIATFLYVTSPFLIMDIDQLCFAFLFYQMPLMFLGFDKILDGKKGYLLAFAVWLMALSGVYFFCMVTVEIAVYGCYKVIAKNSANGVKKIVSEAIIKILNTAKQYVLGICLAAPVFLPTAYGVLFSGRVSGGSKNYDLFFDARTYIKNVLCLFVYVPYHHVTINFTVLVIIILLLRRMEGKKHKVITCLFLVASQLSIIGSMFNGFYQTNQRWFFAFYIYIAFISIDVLRKCLKKDSMVNLLCIIALVQPLFSAFVYEGYKFGELRDCKKNVAIEKVDEYSNVEYEGSRRDHNYFYIDKKSPWIYNSLLSSDMAMAMKSFQNSRYRDVNEILGLDVRPDLQALFNVDYVYSMDGVNAPSYNLDKVTDVLYENKNKTEFGYCYDSLVNADIVEDEIGIDKGMVALSSGIVDSKDTKLLEKYPNNTTVKKSNEIPCVINNKDKKRATIEFDEQKNKQLYVVVDTKNIDFDNDNKFNVNFYVNGNCVNSTDIVPNSNEYSIDRECICCNIGYYYDIDKIELEFTKAQKEYDIKLYSIDLAEYEDAIKNLNENHLQNVIWGRNTIKGDLDISSDQLLYLTIPVNDGWSAYVDGSKVDIHKINYMFMGIDVSRGKHSIELKYNTPFFKEGCIICLITILLICIVFAIYRAKNSTFYNK